MIQRLTEFTNLSEAINNTNFENSSFTFISLMTIISQKNSDASKNILNSFLQSEFVSNFLPKLIKNLPKIVASDNLSEDQMKSLRLFLEECVILFNECLYKFRFHSLNLPIDELKSSIEVLIKIDKFIPFQGNLITDVGKLKKNHLEIYMEDLEKSKMKNTDKKKNPYGINNNTDVPINYKEADLILTEQEIWENKFPIIQAHRKNGSYENWQRYFNTLFYLVREDCYRSLRQSIAGISEQIDIDKKTEKIFKEIYYYKSVMIENFEVSFAGIIITLSFEIFQNRISWNKRMLFGSLVILTPEDFSKFLLGIIVESPEKYSRNKKDKKNNKKFSNNNGRFFCKITLVENNFQQFSDFIKVSSEKKSSAICYHMFESKAYYESYRHILKRIQDIDTRLLPFEDVIINYTQNTDMVPSYMNRLNSTISYGIYQYKIFSETWPPGLVKKLDETQLAALKHGLRNKVAIIQGPPGTGKTYVGGVLTQLLLQNISKNNPILIVCYTNHALDQFLRHISAFESNIVRIGGQCKDETIQQFAIANLRKNVKRNYFPIKKLNLRISQIAKEIEHVTKTLNITSVLDYNSCNSLYPVIIKKIIDEFLDILYGYDLIIYKNNINPDFTRYHSQIYAAWINKNNLEILLTNFNHAGYIQENSIETIINFFNSFYQTSTEHIIKAENTQNTNTNLNNNEEEVLEFEEDEDDEDLLENMDRMELEINSEFFMDNDEPFIDINSDLNDLKIDDADSHIYNNHPKNIDLAKFSTSNLNSWMISHRDKLCIIQSMKMNYLNTKIDTLRSSFEEYNNLLKSKKEIDNLYDIQIIKTKRIVGMTTTGCAKYSTILEQVNFQTIIIEEAAEVLESHITALLTNDVKQMILIGDHQQLKPNPYNYEIATKYNFDLSLFERLINNKVPMVSLGYQRRMRPEFADFVRLIYSNKYIDHEHTFKRPNIKGMNSNIYFIDHRHQEEQNQGLASKSNLFEAKFLCSLARYIIQQGYEATKITILATYIAQVLLIKDHLKKLNIFHVRVCAVDNYQGEENDFILLSLVRSNKENNIGFLKSFNRICVAFSRAILGFYVMGNFDCIIAGQNDLKNKTNNSTSSNDAKMLWTEIHKLAKDKKIISDGLTFKCQKHEKTTLVKSAEDFKNIPEGGCKEICRERMDCGHVCEFFCHNFEHDIKLCKKPCQKILECGHKCSLRCNQTCGLCKEIIEAILPCGHKTEIFCDENPSEVKCMEKRKCKLSCKHYKDIECYKVKLLLANALDGDSADLKCDEDVQVSLNCGHKYTKKCFMDSEDVKCNTKCGKVLPCDHICQGTCHNCLEGTLHIPCNQVCKKILICSHECKQKCSLPCLCSNKKCENICDHGFCKDGCSIPCIKCNEPCSVKCKHNKCKKLCHEICDYICNLQCSIIQKCGHKCMGICGEICPNVCKVCDPENKAFEIYFGGEDDEGALFFKLDCGHVFEVDGLDKFILGMNENQTSTVQIKTCPNKCKNAIKYGNRYRSVLKRSFNDVQAIKKRMMEAYGDNSLYGRVEKLFAVFMNKLSSIEKSKNYTCIKFVSNFKNLKKNDYAMLNTVYNIGCNLKMIYEIEKFEEVENENIDKNNKIFVNHLNVIRNYFNTSSINTYSEEFLKNLNSKIKTLFYYIKFKEKNYGIILYLILEYQDLINLILKNNFLLNESMLSYFEVKFQIIEKEEMMNIINAAGGRWYRCPDGHLYSVGECGRPMEETSCPECKKKIGGRDHVPNVGNIEATF